ncbi:MAG: SCO family protein [Thiothrix sp.]|nr:SCO family protein [Thiothrix sp.]
MAIVLAFFLPVALVAQALPQTVPQAASTPASPAASVTPSAPGYGELPYALPPAGSYALPPLGLAADGKVLDEQGHEQDLYHLFAGKYVLLSFIYSNCRDVNGCPLSSYVLYKIKARLQQQDADLADKLQLVSLSFDPERDTPAVMRLYGKNFQYAGPRGDWRFLTTASEAALAPLLAAYKQDIQREITVNGAQSDDYSHLLRVFLIDPQHRIRNIYSVAFLHPDIVINDVRTLLMASNQQPDNALQLAANSLLSRPGDSKAGYASEAYQTDSLALTQRQGEALDLLALAKNPPLGLPPATADTLSQEKIQLGRKLFYDRRLSFNDTFSCAMCHIPEQGFTNNEIATSVGVEGRSGRRNAPTLYNVAYASRLFHDGRDSRLEEQIWQPLLAHNEMANPSVGYILDKLRNTPDYQGLFEAAFDGQGIAMQTLGTALAAYERSLLAADSAFDRWYFGKDENAISMAAKQGFQLFSGKARCITCHSVDKDKGYALFTDQKLHNTGLGYQESMGIRPAKRRVALAPGVFVDVDQSLIDQVSAPPLKDLGLYEITQNPADRWKYLTPGLRNVALTAPYMHNGRFASLKAVIQFYNQGGIPNETLSPLIQPLNLTETEMGDLQAFLETLTGSNVDTLVADAFAAPVGDLTQADPNWANQLDKQPPETSP